MPNPFDTHKQVIGGTLAPQPGDARALGRFGPELYPHDPAACGLPETLGALAGPLRLVVGRGTVSGGGPWWAPAPEAPVGRWTDVACDRFGGAFVGGGRGGSDPAAAGEAGASPLPPPPPRPPPPPHLWLDFSLETALARIPSAAFTQVVVDWSTWRYMRPLAPGIAAHWRRITAQPGGAWAVEGGVSSYRIVADTAAVPGVPVHGDHGSEISCEFDNPSHVVVREGTVRRWMAQCPDWDGRPPVSAAEAQLDGGVVNGAAAAARPPLAMTGTSRRRSVGQPPRAGRIAQLASAGAAPLGMRERRIIPARKAGQSPLDARTDTTTDRASLEWLDAVVWTFASPLVDQATAAFFRSPAGGGWPVAAVHERTPAFPMPVRGTIHRWVELLS